MSLKALSSVPHALVDVSGMGHDGLRSALNRFAASGVPRVKVISSV